MGLSALDKIREQYGPPKKEPCPHCGMPLTIETTDFFLTRICESCFEFAEIDPVKDCCSKADLQHVRYVVSGGSIQVRQQCKSCGWVSGLSCGGFTKDRANELPLLDPGARERSDQNRYALRREFLKKVSDGKSAIKKEEWFSQYNDYLNSPAWQEKRSAVLKRDNYKCQCCLDALATQVHHRSYEFVDMNGSEPAFDMVSVCSPCHDKIEKMKREQRKIS